MSTDADVTRLGSVTGFKLEKRMRGPNNATSRMMNQVPAFKNLFRFV